MSLPRGTEPRLFPGRIKGFFTLRFLEINFLRVLPRVGVKVRALTRE